MQFVMPGQPPQVMAAWRADPPGAFGDAGPFNRGGFKLADEAYDALTYEMRYYDWPQQITFFATLGLALLFKSFMGSTFKLTARFDAEGETHTKVTIVGHAHPRTRVQLVELANEYGGTLAGRVIA